MRPEPLGNVFDGRGGIFSTLLQHVEFFRRREFVVVTLSTGFIPAAFVGGGGGGAGERDSFAVAVTPFGESIQAGFFLLPSIDGRS